MRTSEETYQAGRNVPVPASSITVDRNTHLKYWKSKDEIVNAMNRIFGFYGWSYYFSIASIYNDENFVVLDRFTNDVKVLRIQMIIKVSVESSQIVSNMAGGKRIVTTKKDRIVEGNVTLNLHKYEYYYRDRVYLTRKNDESDEQFNTRLQNRLRANEKEDRYLQRFARETSRPIVNSRWEYIKQMMIAEKKQEMKQTYANVENKEALIEEDLLRYAQELENDQVFKAETKERLYQVWEEEMRLDRKRTLIRKRINPLIEKLEFEAFTGAAMNLGEALGLSLYRN